MRTPDAYDQWERHEAKQERMLSRLPVCCECGHPIQDDSFYLINDELICAECLNTYYRKNTEDYME